MNNGPKIPFYWILLLSLLPSCVSQKYHRDQVQATKQFELDYAIHLAKRVKDKEMTPREMIKFLEERAE